MGLTDWLRPGRRPSSDVPAEPNPLVPVESESLLAPAPTETGPSPRTDRQLAVKGQPAPPRAIEAPGPTPPASEPEPEPLITTRPISIAHRAGPTRRPSGTVAAGSLPLPAAPSTAVHYASAGPTGASPDTASVTSRRSSASLRSTALDSLKGLPASDRGTTRPAPATPVSRPTTPAAVEEVPSPLTLPARTVRPASSRFSLRRTPTPPVATLDDRAAPANPLAPASPTTSPAVAGTSVPKPRAASFRASGASPKANGTTAVATVSTPATAAEPTPPVSLPNYVLPGDDDLTAVIRAQRRRWADHLRCQAGTTEAGSTLGPASPPLWQRLVSTLEPYLSSLAGTTTDAPSPRKRFRSDSTDASPSFPPYASTPDALPALDFGDDDGPPMRHVVIIGVHGWFPMKFLNRILGEPTGTSHRFCEKAYEGLLQYVRQRRAERARTCRGCGYQADELTFAGPGSLAADLDIDPNYLAEDGAPTRHADDVGEADREPELESVSLIPLTGEGVIADRVALLWDQLVESDMAYQHQAMRTIPVVRRAWHQDADGDPGWLPPTVRAQIQIRQGSRGLTPPSSSSSPTAATAPASPRPRASLSPRYLLCPRCHRGTLSPGTAAPPPPPRLSMMPWLPALYQADTVLVATHSQGTPVSARLLERLVVQGLVDPRRQRVGMLAMAGITHGPFAYHRDNLVVRYIEAEAARELFTMADPTSPAGHAYRAAMEHILNAGVKVVAVGSLVDQVVPLYSAVMHGLSHMHVYRAVYIDGAHFTGDFLTDLVAFALKLRNYGLSDHDLTVHISETLAGSLYSGTPGHSTIYNDTQVYATAVRWVAESIPSHRLTDPAAATSLGFFQKWATFRGRQATGTADAPPAGNDGAAEDEVSSGSPPASFRDVELETRTNPYYLPWIMRSLLADPLIRQHPVLGPDLLRLRERFAEWQPTQRHLKDLKFRLEPLRSSL
ncbi:hypothetical protein IWQ60_009467 [Tieghemiomyces parasiticus]|uniref:YMC020W-like alpha/beta hydrolase domain-containing protein n=1 Tax=Tieghemiomyces parasiticus TaxID=78921 RepID=A0A9W8DQ31_9FUNG|nr:hypothetical protein IWQ60_009467 [Tieghemiomyces parasiticus]